MHLRLWIIVFSLACVASNTFAYVPPHSGLSFSIPLIKKDPEYLYGYRAAFWYQPSALMGKHTQIYFNAAFGHWWVTNTNKYRSLNIYSASPVLRYYFATYSNVSLFINLSIGLAYLSRTRLDDQNLGMHFSFQDEAGIGARLGQTQQLSIMLSALHYSNGSLCSMNAGITVPLVMSIDYGFA